MPCSHTLYEYFWPIRVLLLRFTMKCKMSVILKIISESSTDYLQALLLLCSPVLSTLSCISCLNLIVIIRVNHMYVECTNIPVIILVMPRLICDTKRCIEFTETSLSNNANVASQLLNFYFHSLYYKNNTILFMYMSDFLFFFFLPTLILIGLFFCSCPILPLVSSVEKHS